MFSIIVPIYNIDNYLGKCIQSILSQTYRNFELILVDDGSRDNSPKICDKYAEADDRIKVIHKPNGGLATARKAGAEIAIGKYIVCVDGDDWISENYLEKFTEVIDNYKPQIICCNYYIGTEEKNTETTVYSKNKFFDRADIKSKILPDFLYREHGGKISSTVWGKAFDRVLYTQIQMSVPNEISLGEDAAVVKPCIFKSDSIYIMSDALYFYRYNPTSITKSRKAFDWNSPYIRGKHLEGQIDMSSGTFKNQLSCAVCHMLFNVAVSQFYRQEKFSVISKEIKLRLSDEYYKTKINSARFESKNGWLMHTALKHNLTGLMWLYSKIKRS